MAHIAVIAAVLIGSAAAAFAAADTGAPSAPAAPLYVIPATAQPWKRQYLKAVREVWGLNSPAWLAAQVGQESGWRDGLVSTAAARGMCQFIEGTAAGIERQNAGLAALGRYSPAWCFRAQALLMRDLFRTYSDVRDPCNGIKFAGSAYNGGPSALNREIGLCHKERATCHYEHWSHVSMKNSRAAWAYRENRDYVKRITDRSATYSVAGWGADFCEPAPPVAPVPLVTPPLQ